jgi:hypothetical protein
MRKKIDTKKPVRFIDDRGRDQEYVLKTIIFENDAVCLCDLGLSDENNPVLFSKVDGTVLTDNLPAYIAENYETELTLLAQKAIDYTKKSYVPDSQGIPCMLLGDVAELIKLLTGVKPTMKDLQIDSNKK